MAWIEKRTHSDGGAYQSETFGAGSSAQNLARADGFKKMVEAGGQRWPDGWIRGEGFVRPAGTNPLTPPPRFDVIGEEYVRQIVDLSPGQRKRYLGHLGVLAATRIRGFSRFSGTGLSVRWTAPSKAVRSNATPVNSVTSATPSATRFVSSSDA